MPFFESGRSEAQHYSKAPDPLSADFLDNFVALAARITSSQTSSIVMIGAEPQRYKAQYEAGSVQTLRDKCVLSYIVAEKSNSLVVEDATVDPRFRTNPIVTCESGFQACLGIPLVKGDGHVLGGLFVFDPAPRQFESGMIETMWVLARAVIEHLELRRALLYTRKTALTDLLTGLPNRRAMMDALVDAAADPGRLAVIAIDLDHFKEVNDGEGHAAGDAVLRAAAARLQAAVRPGDLVGRVGGDEFAVLLVGVTDRTVVEEIAQRIRHLLHRPVIHRSRQLRLGATLGIAIVPDDVMEADLVMRVADEALIRAKQGGRGDIGWANQGDAMQLQRAAAIVRAFDADALASHTLEGATACLQPIISLGRQPGSEGRIVSVEALARWSHPDVGEISPDELFTAIGPERAAWLCQVVREKALAAFAALQKAGMTYASIALNLSASEVCRADIAMHIAEQVSQAGLSLDCVELEITEKILLDRISDRTLNQLAILRGRGARLVLDDFGTGTSGLSQLLRLPLDGLKLDKRFVQRLGLDKRADEIVRATVSLGHSLGLQVVAEGVETDEQAAMLRALGCDAAQGFLFARPMSAKLYREWLRERALNSIRRYSSRPATTSRTLTDAGVSLCPSKLVGLIVKVEEEGASGRGARGGVPRP